MRAFTGIAHKLRRINPQLKLFLAGVFLLGAAAGVFETVFNNYVSDTFEISAAVRGRLEFPREFPGFLTAVLAGMLFFLPETMIAAFSAFAVGLGMIGIAALGGKWAPFLCCLVIWSVGAHLIMPVRGSLGVALAADKARGKRLGQIGSVSFAAGLAGCLVVWLLKPSITGDYRSALIIGGRVAIAGGFVFLLMRLPGAHLTRPRFIWNRKYWLFYVLALLFGARKQVFLTFGPWVLVRVFNQPAHIFAKLWIVAAVLGIWIQPWLGKAIDRFGERFILVADSICVLLVCLGYGFSHLIPDKSFALWLLYGCYILDLLLFGVNMARTTYLSKIAVKPEDVSPTLALGVTINHAVSMSLPAVGGLIWMSLGHSAVFMAAAGIAVLMFVFSCMIRTPGKPFSS